jgi:hypothetical protein
VIVWMLILLAGCGPEPTCADASAASQPRGEVLHEAFLPLPTFAKSGAWGCEIEDGRMQCRSRRGEPKRVRGQWSTVEVATADWCGIEQGHVKCGSTDSSMPAFRQTDAQYVDVDIVAGHVCAVREEGSIECWKLAGGGRATRLESPPGDDFARVSVGHRSACGLTREGEVRCWGEEASECSVTAPPGRYVRLDIGSGRVCGIRDDGAVICWHWKSYKGVATPPAPERAMDLRADGWNTWILGESGKSWRSNHNGSSAEWEESSRFHPEAKRKPPEPESLVELPVPTDPCERVVRCLCDLEKRHTPGSFKECAAIRAKSANASAAECQESLQMAQALGTALGDAAPAACKP